MVCRDMALFLLLRLSADYQRWMSNGDLTEKQEEEIQLQLAMAWEVSGLIWRPMACNMHLVSGELATYKN